MLNRQEISGRKFLSEESRTVPRRTELWTKIARKKLDQYVWAEASLATLQLRSLHEPWVLLAPPAVHGSFRQRRGAESGGAAVADVRGIPTDYRGQRFRSLTEARWASFFDKLGWEWEYEPFELDGYIPDFILKFSEPLLVEVKAEVRLDRLEHYARKIERSGWRKEALIVGATLFETDCCSGWPSVGGHPVALGVLGSFEPEVVNPKILADTSYWVWDNAILGWCKNCGMTINQAEQVYSCRRNGCEYKDIDCAAFVDTQLSWREASNRVQWKRT